MKLLHSIICITFLLMGDICIIDKRGKWQIVLFFGLAGYAYLKVDREWFKGK